MLKTLITAKTNSDSTLQNKPLPKSAHSTGNAPIRKRHWFAGSMMIMLGSWVTHTTTATIVSPSPKQDLEIISGDSLAMANFALAKSDILNSQLTASVEINNTDAANSQASLINVIPQPEELEVLTSISHKVRSGDSLGSIFKKKGYNLALPYKISKHPVAKQLVSLSVGKQLNFRFDESDALREIAYPASSLEELVVDIKDGEIQSAEIQTLEYDVIEKTVSASIDSSLFLSAQKAGLSHNLIMEMVRIFGWDIDFVLDIRGGDSYHIVYTEYYKDGQKLKDGDILAAEFTTQGRSHRAVRFVDEDDNVSYYTPEGASMIGTFLRSPVKFSRISSRFGKRKHPISKKWKQHNGTDYAAATGTPVRATADGKVTLAGRKGGYGKTIVIRHAGRFSTLYAHLNGFAKGVRSGSRVKQGDLIGYVGSTGYSTGPHLHYEFQVNGVHRNSLTYKTPKASSISEKSKAKFTQLASAMVSRLDNVRKEYALANSNDKPKSVL